MTADFLIDLEESFPQLGDDAPIVEATIGISALANVEWDEATLTDQLISRLPDYPSHRPVKSFRSELKIDHGAADQNVSDLGWQGVRFESSDQKHVVQCLRERLTFSRLQPYEDWTQFVDEALRLWEIHKEIYQVEDIQRIGLRYINRINTPKTFELGEYLSPPPLAPDGMNLIHSSFFHQDTYNVPGHEYGINLIQTVQNEPSVGLIYDIDVFSIGAIESADRSILEEKLPEMRYIKNKIFYSGLTEKAWRK